MASTATGAILWKEHYSPLGERQVKSSTSTKNSQYFHGKEQDTTTGLQYFGARWYDPMVGRFMAVDPVGVKADSQFLKNEAAYNFNRYVFANNNPHKFIDPDGRDAYLANPWGLFKGSFLDPSSYGEVNLNGNVVLGVSGELTTSAGVGMSHQIYLSTSPLDLGIVSTGSLTTGAAVGGTVQGGIIAGDRSNLEGRSYNANGSVGPVAGSAVFNANGELIGLTAGGGIKGAWPAPGSLSGAANESIITFSTRGVVEKGAEVIKGGWNYLFGGKK